VQGVTPESYTAAKPGKFGVGAG